MTDIHIAFIGLFIIASIWLAMIVQAYIAHKHTEYFESLLPNCTFVTDNKKNLEYAGLPGKILRTGLISMVLALPHIFTRRGLIDLNEVRRFPPRTRRLLVSLLIIHFLLLSALIIFHETMPKL
ncbi:hypothetical protein [Pseudomonas sp. DC3000-4b1]|uniref:hypothetical protein n=1 Tax=unclassified Pseudomonas TaxID=196821 RepID=UPI003CF4EB23